MSGAVTRVFKLALSPAPYDLGATPCCWAVGTAFSGPRACGKRAKWLAYTGTRTLALCGIHRRPADRNMSVVATFEPGAAREIGGGKDKL